jgi:GxxExxY protein
MIQDGLTKSILGACFEVMNELGAGFLESVYEKALLIVLREKGMAATSQVPLPVHFRNQVVGDFYADVLVENKVIVELKTAKRLVPEHLAQVINYLKATNLETGLLVNFGNQKLEYRRLNNKIERIYPQGFSEHTG